MTATMYSFPCTDIRLREDQALLEEAAGTPPPPPPRQGASEPFPGGMPPPRWQQQQQRQPQASAAIQTICYSGADQVAEVAPGVSASRSDARPQELFIFLPEKTPVEVPIFGGEDDRNIGPKPSSSLTFAGREAPKLPFPSDRGLPGRAKGSGKAVQPGSMAKGSGKAKGSGSPTWQATPQRRAEPAWNAAPLRRGEKGGKGRGMQFDGDRNPVGTEQRFGTVAVWQSKGNGRGHGWIDPDEHVSHQDAVRRRGKVFVSERDVDAELVVGARVSYFLYEDNQGLGAGSCRMHVNEDETAISL